jgi:hypothetical protein
METMINVSETTLHLRAEIKRLSTELAVANSDLMMLYRDDPECYLNREVYFTHSSKVNDLSTQLVKVRTAFTDSIMADLEKQSEC